MDPTKGAEARAFLRAAEEWLHEWSRQPEEERHRHPPSTDEIVAHGIAIFLLDGPAVACRWLAGWRGSSILNAWRELASRLIEAGHADGVEAMALAEKSTWTIRTAMAIALFEAGRKLGVELATALLATEQPPKTDEINGVLQASALAALASVAGEISGKALIDAVAKLRPARPAYADRFESLQAVEGRLTWAALDAELRGQAVAVEDLLPPVPEDVEKARRLRDDASYRATLGLYVASLPFHALRTGMVLGRIQPGGFAAALQAARVAAGQALSTHYMMDAAEKGKVAQAATWLSFDAACWAGVADVPLVDGIADWLAKEQIRANAETWTRMARRAALAGADGGTVLRLIGLARETLDADRRDATDAAEASAAIARALLPFDRTEAAEQFRDAGERLGRLGDELRDRLHALLALATKAGEGQVGSPREAYRLARAAEAFERRESHKFPWTDVASAVAALSCHDALAAVSRWRDRDVTSFDRTLGAAADGIVTAGALPASALSVLHALGGWWDMAKVARAILGAVTEAVARQSIAGALLLDLETDGAGRRDFVALREAAAEHGIALHSRDLADAAEGSTASSSGGPDPLSFRPQAIEEQQTPDWSALLSGLDLLSAKGVDAVLRAAREQASGRASWHVYGAMRAMVPAQADARAKHVAALAVAEEHDAWDITRALEQAVENWDGSLAVRQAVAAAARRVAGERSVGHVIVDLNRLARLAKETDAELAGSVLNGAAARVEAISAEGLYGLAACCTRLLLAPEQALGALSSSLDRVEPLLDDQDGDGPWSTEREAPRSASAALAGLLFAALGAPRPEMRWRGTHAVRRACLLGLQEVVAELVVLYRTGDPGAFTDLSLPFYVDHARLHFLIACARASTEAPAILVPYLAVFHTAAVEGTHVLMQLFASRAALALAAARPGLLTAGETARLQKVGKSAFLGPPPHAALGTLEEADSVAEPEEERGFHYDFDRYWLDPLAAVFDVTRAELASRMKAWVRKAGLNISDGHWRHDPRALRGLYGRTGDTWGSHGGYPQTDGFGFYMAYHAMFRAAGKLLAERPAARGVYGREDLWAEWLRRHDLSRDDGGWLADRRDPKPLGPAMGSPRVGVADWQWAIKRADLEGLISGFGNDVVPVYGSWDSGGTYVREMVSIRAALASRDTAPALVRALQTAENLEHVALPFADDDYLECRLPGFRLCGIVATWDHSYGPDDSDPFGAAIVHPGPSPSRSLRRLLGLRRDGEGRVWVTRSGILVGRVLVWSEPGDAGDRTPHPGTVALVEKAPLLDLLGRLDRDLILSASLRRIGERSTEEIGYVQTSMLFFRLGPDGRFRTWREGG